MDLLTTKQKVSDVLQVAIGYNEKQFDVFIREAQDFDFKTLFCEEFYNDMVVNKDQAPYVNLLSGETYEYDGRSYMFRGLEDVLNYFTYARFIIKCNYVSSSHGFTIKKTPHSEPMPLDEKRNMYYKYKQDANKIFEDVKKYVERNISDFPLWDYCEENCQPKSNNGFITRVIQ